MSSYLELIAQNYFQSAFSTFAYIDDHVHLIIKLWENRKDKTTRKPTAASSTSNRFWEFQNLTEGRQNQTLGDIASEYQFSCYKTVHGKYLRVFERKVLKLPTLQDVLP